MLSELKDKTALVTGAAKRLGRETALTLADRGINIIIHFNHSDDEARQLAAELQQRGVKVWTIQADFEQAFTCGDDQDDGVGVYASYYGERGCARAYHSAARQGRELPRKSCSHRTAPAPWGEQDIADAIAFLIQSDFITGNVIYVDGGRHLHEYNGSHPH
jgi:NAD(P)-dependent dehydrogenase (short-subunit alcohol dehydrogenase family)